MIPLGDLCFLDLRAFRPAPSAHVRDDGCGDTHVREAQPLPVLVPHGLERRAVQGEKSAFTNTRDFARGSSIHVVANDKRINSIQMTQFRHANGNCVN